MSKKILKKAFKKWSDVIIMVSIALSVALVIQLVDEKKSIDENKKLVQKDLETERIARKTIPVEYGRFVELIESFHQKHRESIHIGQPVFVQGQNITKLPISRGHVLFTGKNEKTEWCNDSLCVFHTEVLNDSVVVVSCPADLMARLVEDYEKK